MDVTYERTAVSGVPTIVVAEPGLISERGEVRAVLSFRVGRVDESLPTSGRTHLVEHLALHALNIPPTLKYNGMVEGVATSFLCEGTWPEVRDFLAGVSRSLGALPAGRLAGERRVLEAESNARGSTFYDALALWRWGARSLGVVAYGEFGLRTADVDALAAWSREVFTSGNAVLWIAGDVPADVDLELDLPDGPLRPVPRMPVTVPQFPAYFASNASGSAVSMTVSRTGAATAYAAVLGTRMHEVLREELALAYSPTVSYQRLSAERAYIVAGADGVPDHVDDLADALQQLIADLARTPVEQELLDRLRDRPIPRVEQVSGYIDYVASEHLLGAEPMTFAELEGERASLTPERIREVAAEAQSQALYLLPQGHAFAGRGILEAPVVSTTVVTGTSYSLVGRPTAAGELIVGPEGISQVAPRITVKYAQTEALLAWPDGARRLIGWDGFGIQVEPTLWRKGKDIVAAIDAGVPADRHIPMPEREPADIPQPSTLTKRLRRVIRG